MPTKTFFVTCVALVAGTASIAAAQEHVEGDPVAGEQAYGAQCVACHGSAGNSLVPSQPIIAGQYAEYTSAQMHAFKDGSRVNAIMQPFATSLSDADIANLAVYLEGQQAGLSGAQDKGLAEAGQSLYRNGIAASGVPNCTGCHGPAGRGIPPLYPRLSGQHATYTASSLREFREGTRVNNVMNDIAANLTDGEIQALSEYISGLH